MSKMNAQRAMREANYAARQKATGASDGARAARRTPPVAPAVPATGAETTEAVPSDAAEGACGHRSMNGRTCTRPSGHEEKNHRYS